MCLDHKNLPMVVYSITLLRKTRHSIVMKLVHCERHLTRPLHLLQWPRFHLESCDHAEAKDTFKI